MIGNNYKIHKDNVIDLYNGYIEKRGNLSDGVDVEFLEKRINSLKNGKYTIAVAGEVKAGKSTFINALLGAEVLPTDVLQATNAIVEIYKSEKSFLRVKYANGNEEKIYDDITTPDIDEARERLHEICCVHDEYREIPTTLIDEDIIASSLDLLVTDSLITKWEEQSSQPLVGQTDLLKQYIKGRTKATIPVEIDFGYPLHWDFDELRIVDSPGVNAIGGVQDISFQFFENANAILFVLPIKPVESESFRKFVDSVISNRSRETLFLVLTHAGIHPDRDVEKLHNEAIRLYKDCISPERILVVDSLLKLIHQDITNDKTIKEIRKSENKKKVLASYRELAEDEGLELKDVVLDGSRFVPMFEAIDKFSMQAPNLQLQEILVSIKKGYVEQNVLYKEKIERSNNKKKNPQQFEAEINRISSALEKYKLLINKTKEDLTSKYTGKHSEWHEEISSLKAKYPELITNSSSLELARKNLQDAIDEVEGIINGFSNCLTSELSNVLEEEGKKFKQKHKITLPKVDLKAIEEKSKKSAYRIKAEFKDRKADVWDYLGLGVPRLFRVKKVKVGEKKIYDKEQHLTAYKEFCNKSCYELFNDLPDKSKDVLNKYLKGFNVQINHIIKERQKSLEVEKNRKQSNNEIIAELECLKLKKKSIEEVFIRVEEILEDLI